MEFKNKKILITAGPTWVALDKVRVISNIATGKTGILLAEKLSKLGAKVTLLLGPVQIDNLDTKIRVVNYRFFHELSKLLKNELQKKKYNIVIHSAAVSDYQPRKALAQKVKSGINNWIIKLAPTEKIIDSIKKISPESFLVGFKFEPDSSREYLFRQARLLMQHAKADLVVANTSKHRIYSASILGEKRVLGPFEVKPKLVNALIKEMGDIYVGYS